MVITNCLHFFSFYFFLTEYIQAMILVNDATISKNSTLKKCMYISYPNPGAFSYISLPQNKPSFICYIN